MKSKFKFQKKTYVKWGQMIEVRKQINENL